MSSAKGGASGAASPFIRRIFVHMNPPTASSESSHEISNSTLVSWMKPAGFRQAIFRSFLPHCSGIHQFAQISFFREKRPPSEKLEIEWGVWLAWWDEVGEFLAKWDRYFSEERKTNFLFSSTFDSKNPPRWLIFCFGELSTSEWLPSGLE